MCVVRDVMARSRKFDTSLTILTAWRQKALLWRKQSNITALHVNCLVLFSDF